MLKHLVIRNYALIKQLEMRPSPQLNVITGETGAGKSIMLGALGLLMGNRADTKVLWDEKEKCVVEAVFEIGQHKLEPLFAAEDLDYDDLTVFRREIAPSGKSRAFINDTPVTLDVLRKIATALMDIHSQHETLLLGNQSFQLQLIDAYAGNESLKEEYTTAWLNYTAAKKAFEALSEKADTLREEADFVKFQLEEFTSAALEEDEQQKLEAELSVMEHAEEIKTKFVSLLQVLRDSEYSAHQSLSDARGHFQSIANFTASYQKLFDRLESARLELADIVDEIQREGDAIEFDASRLEAIKERLSIIYRLQQKHRAQSIRELLEIQQRLQEKFQLTSNLDDELAKAAKTLSAAEADVKKMAAALSDTRRKVFDPLRKQLTRLLKELGMPEATLAIDVQTIEAGPTGADRIEVLFSANKGIPPKPLAQVASGGEFARLMFALKHVMAEKTAMPTLVLDEIDSGISGEIAIKLGDLMKVMSTRHQVITITHLPQVAAKGQTHYYVYKDNSAKKTVSNIKELSADERVEEIAKMIGGDKPSRVAIENAQELIRR